MPAMEVVVRPARAGDGADLARGWTDAGRYYAELDPGAFRVPAADAWPAGWRSCGGLGRPVIGERAAGCS
jgi:hypothetical protein